MVPFLAKSPASKIRNHNHNNNGGSGSGNSPQFITYKNTNGGNSSSGGPASATAAAALLDCPITMCLLRLSPRFWMGAVIIVSLSQIILWGALQTEHAELAHHPQYRQKQLLPKKTDSQHQRQCSSSSSSINSIGNIDSQLLLPEPWPLAGDATSPRSGSSNLKCGSASKSPYGKYLHKEMLWKTHGKLRKQLVEGRECPDVLIILGAALETHQVKAIVRALEGRGMMEDHPTDFGTPDSSSTTTTSTTTRRTRPFINSKQLLKDHGRCFFLFVRERDMNVIQTSTVVNRKGSTPDTVLLGHIWILPLPDEILPFSKSAQNELIIKYTASYLWFPPTLSLNTSIIWQDAEFFDTQQRVKRQPKNYRALLTQSETGHPTRDTTTPSSADPSPCITVYGTPIIPATFGRAKLQHAVEKSQSSSPVLAMQNSYRPQFLDRCQAMMDALVAQTNEEELKADGIHGDESLSPSALLLQRQCRAYWDQELMMATKHGPHHNVTWVSKEVTHTQWQGQGQEFVLNHGLVDPAMIVWNRDSLQCRDFAATFQCTILDELLQCHTSNLNDDHNSNKKSHHMKEHVTWPYAMLVHGLKARRTTNEYGSSDDYALDSRRENIDFVVGNQRQMDVDAIDGNEGTDGATGQADAHPVMIRRIRSACHWDISPLRLGNCPYHKPSIQNENHQKMDDPTSLAIVVAGSSQRLLFNSTVQHVMKPMLDKSRQRTKEKQSTEKTSILIDYFAIFTLQAGPAFRQDAGYMGHLAYDPLFYQFMALPKAQQALVALGSNETTPTATDLLPFQSAYLHAISDAIDGANAWDDSSSAATLRSLRILPAPLEKDKILDEMRKKQKLIFDKKQQKLKRLKMPHKDNNTFDLFDGFPMKDDREKAVDRTRAGNKNMVRLFLALQTLWTQNVMIWEHAIGQPYDYVLIVRDDALWLDDFDLETVVATNPNADAYILSCDARDPAMLEPEINDHGVLIKREKANVLGQYLTSMVRTDLQACHASVEKWLGKDRGCNSEMILKHVLAENNITVQLVPQSVLPFERAVVVELMDGSKEHCFHKFCQSKDRPLALPADMRRCQDIKF